MNHPYRTVSVFALLLGTLLVILPLAFASPTVPPRISLPLLLREDTSIAERYLVYNNLEGLIVSQVNGNGRRILSEQGGSHPLWSPDGTKIAFYRCPSNSETIEFYWVAPDGTNETLITTIPAEAYYTCRSEVEHRWLANGQYLVFRVDSTLQVYSIASGTTHSLTTVLDDFNSYAVSSNGNHLSFVERIGTRQNLAIYHLQSNEIEFLETDVGYIQAHEWAPNTNRLIVATSDSFYVVNADGSGQVMLDLGVISGVKWSPDERWVSYYHMESMGANSQIFIVSPDGITRRQVADGLNDYSIYAWSLDSQHLAFYRKRSDQPLGELWRYALASEITEMMTTTEEPTKELQWQADGSLFILEEYNLIVIPYNGDAPYRLPLCVPNQTYLYCRVDRLLTTLSDGRLVYHRMLIPTSQATRSYLMQIQTTDPNAIPQPLSTLSYGQSDDLVLGLDNRAGMFQQRYVYENHGGELVVRDMEHGRTFRLSDRGVSGSWAPLGYAPP